MPPKNGETINQQGWRPVPDPTTLTTQQLNAAIDALREVIETRLDAMDKAIELLQSASDRFILRIDEKICSLRAVHEEKFSSIKTQFSERDVRTEQTAKDSKVAVDAALQAAKEAVGEQNKSSALAIAKSETATTKQMDAIGLLIQSTTKGIDDKIDDIKTRLTIIEGIKQGGKEQTQGVSTIVAIVAAIIGILVPAAVVIVTLAKAKTG